MDNCPFASVRIILILYRFNEELFSFDDAINNLLVKKESERNRDSEEYRRT